MPFEQILGNEKVKDELIKQIQTDHVLHSYLFVGNEGIGKKRMATEFAKMLLCREQEKPCGHCKSCIAFDGDNHPDFHIVEASGTIKIEQIRMLQEKTLEKPIISNRKVYLIDDSEKMTTEAQNCLLKTLEEPPEYITIILLTSNESKILKTILSRCTKIYFEPISDEILMSYLQKQGETVTKQMIQMCEGSLKKAKELQEKIPLYQEVEKICKELDSISLLALFQKAKILYENKEEIEDLLAYMNILFLEKSKQERKGSIHYLNAMQLVERTMKKIQGNSNFDMSLDQLLFQIWEEINS